MPRTNQATNRDFDRFWNLYALKRDKVAAQRAWQRLTAADRRAAIDGIPAYHEACQQRGIAMMYPQGYLNHRRWEDEAEPEAKPVSSFKFQVSSRAEPADRPVPAGFASGRKSETCNLKPETIGTPAPGPVPGGSAVGSVSVPLSPTPPSVGNGYYDPDTGMELW